MKEAAGAVLVCAVEGTALTREERAFYSGASPSGLTLFTRNVPPEQRDLAKLVRELQELRPAGRPPLVIAIDQEGGRVARLKAPFPQPGPAMKWAAGLVDAAALGEVKAIGADFGEKLRALGINVDFAPVLDVLTEPSNNAIGDRSFGTDVKSVVARAGAFLQGLQTSGVKGCLKHFPGQGDAKVDTHAGKALVDLPIRTLEGRELAPYRALLPHCDLVMISHCIYPAWDKIEASRSAKVMGGLLRGEMGFEGVIVSDDMNMGAIPQDLGPWQDAIIETVAAGADMVLVCRDLAKCHAAHEALVRAAQKSKAFAERLTQAASRVLKLRAQLF